MTTPDEMLDDPTGSELAVEYGLSAPTWRAAVDKSKTADASRSP